jgi:hypothetical protein
MKLHCLTFFIILFTIIVSIVYFETLTKIFTINSTKPSSKQPISYAKLKKIKYNFIDEYQSLLECNWKNYPKLTVNELNNYESLNKENYSQQAPKWTNKMRITRGIIVNFPIESLDVYRLEFKWLYRSWIEMQKSESKYWRSDLVVFISKNNNHLKDNNFFIYKLNCSFSHRRKSRLDKPMCILIDYEPLKKRNKLPKIFLTIKNHKRLFQNFLTKSNILSLDENKFIEFYSLLKAQLTNYKYVDSILMAFDGYKYFKSAGYDFLIKSDMDVFLTPYFGRWLPKYCNDFYVGRGRYSTIFNMNRLNRVAKNVNFETASKINLGSTWYSGVDQFRLISYLTLLSMCMLSAEEFTSLEKSGRLGVKTWPQWHYGVLSLYGQSLAMNHLIKSKQMNIVRLDNHLDYPSHSNVSINQIIALHAYHTGKLFSKYEFKLGKYDKLRSETFDFNIVKYYSLKMALEAKHFSNFHLKQMLNDEMIKKI